MHRHTPSLSIKSAKSHLILFVCQVAWIYKGTGGRTVLTVATQVITKNPRISAAQEAQAWVLTVTKLTRKDQGVYMCQVNTKPVRKQLGFIRVVGE
ncbi:hypothetical protein E2C01_076846 [Portunus trituberculatus]|uniref:Immunoglobulin V-set domain-containing protein n=1 Tax=Portunus trituberculatus TaxID=210409 RepID=A0A5B7IKQ6_PORTR|nr:hypothetical protein [Portunus trituberculatus]